MFDKEITTNKNTLNQTSPLRSTGNWKKKKTSSCWHSEVFLVKNNNDGQQAIDQMWKWPDYVHCKDQIPILMPQICDDITQMDSLSRPEVGQRLI